MQRAIRTVRLDNQRNGPSFISIPTISSVHCRGKNPNHCCRDRRLELHAKYTLWCNLPVSNTGGEAKFTCDIYWLGCESGWVERRALFPAELPINQKSRNPPHSHSHSQAEKTFFFFFFTSVGISVSKINSLSLSLYIAIGDFKDDDDQINPPQSMANVVDDPEQFVFF